MIEIEVDDADVQRAFYMLELRLNDTALAMYLQGAMEPFLRMRGSQRFAGEGDDAVGTWAPLKYPTQQIRISKGFGGAHPINKRTGILENYITHASGAIGAAPGGVQLTYPGTQPSGNLYEKLVTAQAGRPNPPTVPRPVLGVGPTDMAFFQTSLLKYIETGTT